MKALVKMDYGYGNVKLCDVEKPVIPAEDWVLIKVGDRVVAEPQIKNCGICEFCRSGRMHLCLEKWMLGWRTNGSMGEFVALPEMGK